jgi:hypothetical protein
MKEMCMKERIFFICTFLTASVLFAKEFFQEEASQMKSNSSWEKFTEDYFVQEEQKIEKREKKLSQSSPILIEERMQEGNSLEEK